jgi:predicted secreted protein
MKIDKYIICECGKRKRIHWNNLAEFKRGEISFCVGASKCKKCGVLETHCSGNEQDIMEFLSILEAQDDEPVAH